MIIFIVLAVLSITYGFIVVSVASGSKFFLFWFLLGAIFLLCGVGVKRNWYLLLPKWLMGILGALALVGMAVFLFLMVKIGACFEYTCDTPLDYIIPSVVLKYRLDCAAEYLEKNPGTICIVTGAKGSNERVTEARGMADYLISAGIAEERIILEEQATNTSENIRYSKALLPSGDVTVGIVTNNFHVYRALGIAKKQGIEDATGLAAGSSLSFLPNNMTREAIGVLKDLAFGNMVFW